MFQEQTERLTRKQKRLLKQKGLVPVEHEPRNPFQLRNVEPLTENQRKAFQSYFDDNKNLLLHGIAGTGKTFLSMYFALSDVLSNNTNYKKVVIVRSVVPTRDMGFLPGNQAEKSKVYEAPYFSICTELFGRGDAYDILKNKKIIDFVTTSFIRGITLNNTIIIVDETQNLTLHELDSVITRIGKNCKVIYSGDFRQSDLTKEQERNGLRDFMRILDNMKSFEYVEFDQNDIVRSSIVKEYIITKDKLKIHT